jgi:hypothetical protein
MEVFDHGAFGFTRRALEVSVLDPQDERAPMSARKQPVEERRARIANMQLAGRTRGEA